MVGLLIADKSAEFRKNMANLFIGSEYNVIVTNSAASALIWVLKNEARVVIVSRDLLDSEAPDLLNLLRRCNRKLTIILVSDDVPISLLRKYRRQGIFYHALRPAAAEDKEELLQAVQCAFQSAYGEAIPFAPQSPGARLNLINSVPERRQPCEAQ